ncbi:MAG: hypothetical protein WC408_06880, partial [Candidatus Micrarchaeia archaeon]
STALLSTSSGKPDTSIVVFIVVLIVKPLFIGFAALPQEFFSDVISASINNRMKVLNSRVISH